MWLSCAAFSARLRIPVPCWNALRCSSLRFSTDSRSKASLVVAARSFSSRSSIPLSSQLSLANTRASSEQLNRWCIRSNSTAPKGNASSPQRKVPPVGGARGTRRVEQSKRSQSLVLYLMSMGLAMFALAFASAPLYSVFCRVSGLGGSSRLAKLSASAQREAEEKMKQMKPLRTRKVRVRFEADVDSTAYWDFAPVVREVSVYLGEPTLAFFTATNPTDADAIGIATYTILPYEAAQYFIKVQCFCFDEQRIGAHETVQLPVLFYVDVGYDAEPRLEFVDDIVLSYTFLESKDAEELLAASPRPPHAPLPPSAAADVTQQTQADSDAQAIPTASSSVVQ